jgi:hypothetical protein
MKHRLRGPVIWKSGKLLFHDFFCV